MDPPQRRHWARAKAANSMAVGQTCAPKPNSQSATEVVQLNATKQEQAKDS